MRAEEASSLLQLDAGPMNSNGAVPVQLQLDPGDGKKRKRRKDHKKADRQRKAQKRLEQQEAAAAAAAAAADEGGGDGEDIPLEHARTERGEPGSGKKKRAKKGGEGGGWGGEEEAEPVAAQPVERQAEWLWGQYKECRGGSFLGERKAFEGCSMISVSSAGSFEDRMKQSVKDWRAKFCGGTKMAKQKALEGAKGAPTVLVITAGAQRAADLIREMPECHASCKIAKLFAKHFKVEQQMEMLRQHVKVAVGTPNRLKKLVDIGALSLTNLQLVVLDVHRDVKNYHLLSLKGVKEDLWDLFASHLQGHVETRNVKMAIAAGPPGKAATSGKKTKKSKADPSGVEDLDASIFPESYSGY